MNAPSRPKKSHATDAARPVISPATVRTRVPGEASAAGAPVDSLLQVAKSATSVARWATSRVTARKVEEASALVAMVGVVATVEATHAVARLVTLAEASDICLETAPKVKNATTVSPTLRRPVGVAKTNVLARRRGGPSEPRVPSGSQLRAGLLQVQAAWACPSRLSQLRALSQSDAESFAHQSPGSRGIHPGRSPQLVGQATVGTSAMSLLLCGWMSSRRPRHACSPRLQGVLKFRNGCTGRRDVAVTCAYRSQQLVWL